MEKARQYTALAAAFAALAALTACSGERGETAAPVTPPVPYAEGQSTAPVRAARQAEFVWRFDASDQPLLARGIPGSELVDIVFRCESPASGASFAAFQPGPPPKTLRLSSGDQAIDYPVRHTGPDVSVNTDWSLASDAAFSDPVLTAFMKTGKLTRGAGADAAVWDARSESDSKAISDFAKACGILE